MFFSVLLIFIVSFAFDAKSKNVISKLLLGDYPHLIATDFSHKMLLRTQKKCRAFSNVEVKEANILHLDYFDAVFDVVVAANVIHLLDEPLKALSGGRIIIPTYMNKEKTGRASGFSKTVGKAGADFKQAFTLNTYKEFFQNAGYDRVRYSMINGRVPCAVATIERSINRCKQ